MGQVAITLNGRTYRILCEDGEEPRVHALAATVADKLEGLLRQFGTGAHERLLVMATLLLADDLLDTRERLLDSEARATRLETGQKPPTRAAGA
jgi:cell division protein ZapA